MESNWKVDRAPLYYQFQYMVGSFQAREAGKGSFGK
jgi:hypothetical protein